MQKVRLTFMNEKSKNETGKLFLEWDLRALKLPKQVEADPRGQNLLNVLAVNARPLWPGGKIMAPVAIFKPALAEVLRSANTSGMLMRGLEDTESKLAAENRGLNLVDRKSGVLRGERVSRLLVLADDGAERFYRQVEKLLRLHGPRLLALRLDVNAETLGQKIFDKESRVLLLLLDHKDAVSDFLLALAE
jgi:hypothetical protein